MAPSEMLSVRNFKNAGGEIISSPFQFVPGAMVHLHKVERVIPTNSQWKPVNTPSFFATSEATIKMDNTIGAECIKELRLSTMGRNRNEHGIEIANERDAAYVNVYQSYRHGESIGTTVIIQDLYGTHSKGQLELTHSLEKKNDQKKFDIQNSAVFGLTPAGKEEIEKLGIFKGFSNDISWQIEWDFIKKNWRIVDGLEKNKQELQADQIILLKKHGFIIPETIVLDNFVGMKMDTNINGRRVEIEVPSDIPQKKIPEAFIEGIPFMPLSIKLDGEERVPDATLENLHDWYTGLTTMHVSEKDRKKYTNIPWSDDHSRFSVSSPLFNNAQIIVGLQENQTKKVLPIDWAFQELVRGGLQQGGQEQAFDVQMRYNSAHRKEIESEFFLRSKAGYTFVLKSEMNTSSQQMDHRLRMAFSAQTFESLKEKSQLLADFLGSDPKLYLRMVLDWSEGKREFVFREFRDHSKEGSPKETVCPREIVRDILGFDINVNDLRLETPIAHLAAKVDGTRYSVTVPASFKDFDVKKNILNGKPMVPMTVYTDTSGEWTNVLI